MKKTKQRGAKLLMNVFLFVFVYNVAVFVAVSVSVASLSSFFSRGIDGMGWGFGLDVYSVYQVVSYGFTDSFESC